MDSLLNQPMRSLIHRIKLLQFLGELFRDISSDLPHKFTREFKQLEDQLPAITSSNPWFTADSIYRAISTWGDTLSHTAIKRWHSEYNLSDENGLSRKVLVIMAGNIPLVGFHDFICTIISGHHFLGKLSSRDNILFPLIQSWILEYDNEWENYIELTTSINPEVDIIIATGSNNTSRLISQKFTNVPGIIRHNRNSIGLVSENDNKTDLENLAKDILWYYGLGCRNVSLLFFPADYDLSSFIQIIEKVKMFLPAPFEHNLIYQRAKNSMHNIIVRDAGKILFINDENLNSPLGIVHYTYYSDQDEIDLFRKNNSSQIQCTVGNPDRWTNVIPFGQSQKPELNDYADGIDTLKFLISLS